MVWRKITAIFLALCLLAGCGTVVEGGGEKPRASLDSVSSPVLLERVPTEPATEPATLPPTEPETMPEPTEEETVPSEETTAPGQEYVLNKNSKKFHYPSCSSAGQIKDSNKELFYGTREELIDRGYDPCKRCYP